MSRPVPLPVPPRGRADEDEEPQQDEDDGDDEARRGGSSGSAGDDDNDDVDEDERDEDERDEDERDEDERDEDERDEDERDEDERDEDERDDRDEDESGEGDGGEEEDRVAAMVGARVDGLLLTKLLGLGTYGAVYVAEDITPVQTVPGNPKAKYAIKCLFKAGLAPEHLAVQRQEVDVNRRLGYHKHVTHMSRVFESDAYMLLVFEFCDRGDLFELIKRDEAGLYDKKFAAELFLQLLDAVAFCHSRSVYHRDLKPENVLLTADWTVKLGDFGLAACEEHPRDFGCGSPPYMAPEVFGGAGPGAPASYSAAAADTWSLGVILFNMLYGANPWERAVPTDRHFKTFKAAPRKSLSERFAMTDELLEVFLGMFALDPASRWPIARIRRAIEGLNLNAAVPATGNKYSSSPAVHLQAGHYMRQPRPALNKAPLPPEAYADPMVVNAAARTTTKGFVVDAPSASIEIPRRTTAAVVITGVARSGLSAGSSALSSSLHAAQASSSRKLSKSWADSADDDDDDLPLPAFNDNLADLPLSLLAAGMATSFTHGKSPLAASAGSAGAAAASLSSPAHFSPKKPAGHSPLRESVTAARHDSAYESYGDNDAEPDETAATAVAVAVTANTSEAVSAPTRWAPSDQAVAEPEGSDGALDDDDEDDDDGALFALDMDDQGVPRRRQRRSRRRAVPDDSRLAAAPTPASTPVSLSQVHQAAIKSLDELPGGSTSLLSRLTAVADAAFTRSAPSLNVP